jgi:hypothetical protein
VPLACFGARRPLRSDPRNSEHETAQSRRRLPAKSRLRSVANGRDRGGSAGVSTSPARLLLSSMDRSAPWTSRLDQYPSRWPQQKSFLGNSGACLLCSRGACTSGSFASRSGPLIIAVLALSAGAALVAQSKVQVDVRISAGLAGLVGAFGLAVHGARERRRASALGDLVDEVTAMRRQMSVFLDALDARAHALDRRESALTQSAGGSASTHAITSPPSPAARG